MAAFPVHISVSAMLGAAYGTYGMHQYPDMDWGQVFLGAGVTTAGGMLPDLDSDSGIPVREIFGIAATAATILSIPRLHRMPMSPEQRLVILLGIYLVVKYIVAEVFKQVTVHRGMFHSIPAMLISGLSVFVLYHHTNLLMRVFLSIGVMIGFASHLILDEIYAVDLNGVVPKLNQFAGSAIKLTSKSWTATLLTYGILAGLLGLSYRELKCDELFCPNGDLRRAFEELYTGKKASP